MNKQRKIGVLVAVLMLALLALGAGVYGKLSGQKILQLTKCGQVPYDTKTITWDLSSATASQTYNYAMVNNVYYKTYTLPVNIATTSTDELTLAYVPENATITAIGFIPNTAITGDNTNYATLTFYYDSASTTTNRIGYRAYTRGNDVAKFDVDTTFGTLANTTVAAGHMIHVDKTVASGGMTIDGLAFVTFRLR